MTDFEVRQLTLRRVCRKRDQAVSLDVVEPQLRAGMRALAADDDPHPSWPVLVEVEQPGQFRDVSSFPHFAIGVVGRHPRINPLGG